MVRVWATNYFGQGKITEIKKGQPVLCVALLKIQIKNFDLLIKTVNEILEFS